MLFILNRMKVKSLIPYLIGGVIMWFYALRNSRHCYRSISLCHSVWKRRQRLYLICLQHFLHKPVGFNTSSLCTMQHIVISSNIGKLLLNITVSIPLGLIIGKTIGIYLFSLLAVSLGI
jgi:NhaA family Na+:H+ antiporter